MAKDAGVSAGRFGEWLHDTEASFRSGKGGADVPCGSCTACCRSSMFIHIRPDELETLERIPTALLFPAPGRPRGHVLLGYDDKGHCPMLVEHRCSIYEHRPQTCRTYDCRIFAATGIPADEEAQPDIADRVKAWVFTYDTDDSRTEQTMLRAAGTFLQKRGDLFPERTVPGPPRQLPVVAVRIFRLFEVASTSSHDGVSAPSDAMAAQAIRNAVTDPR